MNDHQIQSTSKPSKTLSPNRDFVAGLVFMAISIVFLFQSTDLPIGSLRSMGPGYFPLAAGCLLFVLSVLMIIGSRSGGKEIEAFNIRGMVFLGVSPLVFLVLVANAGLTISVYSACFCSMLSNSNSTLRFNLVTSFFITAGSVVLFKYGLGLSDNLWPSVVVAG